MAPPGASTRPTSDRVREAIFNALGSLGAVEGAVVLDLFAGSGALGIEALSRGAASAVFVDRDAKAVAAVRANLASSKLEDRATVVRGDAMGWLDGARSFDLALLDPPYGFTDEEWTAVIGRLPGALVVAESDRELVFPPGWTVIRAKRYGGTVVTIARQEGSPSA